MNIKKVLGLREMTLDDIDTVYDIERRCFYTSWSAQAFRESLAFSEAIVLYLLSTQEVIGFFVGIPAVGEYNICNIAVTPEYQGKGYAYYMVSTIIAQHKNKFEDYYLEVRRSNQKAISLYHRLGFRISYVRKDYYNNPTEDALVMRRTDEKI